MNNKKLSSLFSSDRKSHHEEALIEWEGAGEDDKKFLLWLVLQKEKVENKNNSSLLYSLGITDQKPKENEYIKRSGGAGLCDIDYDTGTKHRSKLIKYVTEKYGENNTSHIITFGEMKARLVVRDVGRAMGVPLPKVDKIAKLIPEVVGSTLQKAIDNVEALQDLIKDDKEVARLIDVALKLEGTKRHTGKHAAGIIIAPRSVEEFGGVFRDARDGSIATQLDMYDAEKIGLVKMDFLGLRNLDVIKDCVESVKETLDEEIDIDSIPLDDAKTYELFSKGYTSGVFQFESSGMKETLTHYKPDRFEDLMLLNALYRPGPMDFIDDVVDVKHNPEKLNIKHDALKPILKDTFGVMIFQEQVMKISQVMAGFSPGQADHLRKVMGKKLAKEMPKLEKKFIKGAEKQGYTKEDAKEVFDQIEKFSNYGFCAAHSCAYSLIAYQTAYLKAHYPLQFMAALMSSDMKKVEVVAKYFYEATKMGLDLAMPHINHSFTDFTVSNDEIVFGLGAVKGIGSEAMRSIIKERKTNGVFTSIYDFVERTSSKFLNKKVLSSLIKCGALDSFGTRQALYNDMETWLSISRSSTKDRADGQGLLFDAEETQADMYIDGKEWPEDSLLENELESLGFYASGHPIDKYSSVTKNFVTDTIADLRLQEAYERPEKAVLAVTVHKVELKQSKTKGTNYASLTISDPTGQIEVLAFKKSFSKIQKADLEKRSIVLRVWINSQNDQLSMFVDDFDDIENFGKLAKSIMKFPVKMKDITGKIIDEAKSISKEFPGGERLLIDLISSQGKCLTVLTDIKSSGDTQVVSRYKEVFNL